MEIIKPGETHIKNPEIMRTIFERRGEPILINIQEYLARKYGIVITEWYREKLHMNDLHGCIPVRAMDLRFRCYPEPFAYNIMQDINNTWEYDYKRPEKLCGIIHNAGNGIHFHVQVSPNTRRR